MISRTKTILCAGLLCLLGLGADAADKVYRIGIITYAGLGGEGGEARLPIKDLLAARGYVEGKNVVYEFRSADRDPERVDRYARELVAWKPDLIIGLMTNADIAVKKAAEGTNIPVVVWSTDLLEAGLVKSFARSGTNFTGFAYEPWIQLLQLRFLKLAAPDTVKVAHLYNHTYAPAPSTLRGLQEAAKLLGMQIKVYEVLKKDELAAAFAAMKADGMQAVAIGPHELFNTNGPTIGGLLLQYRFPAVACCQVSIARGGALGAFSPPNGWPAMAERIDLILQGKANPADLPILRTVASPFTLNLKAAAQLGLKLPQSLIDEANVLIQ